MECISYVAVIATLLPRSIGVQRDLQLRAGLEGDLPVAEALVGLLDEEVVSAGQKLEAGRAVLQGSYQFPAGVDLDVGQLPWTVVASP